MTYQISLSHTILIGTATKKCFIGLFQISITVPGANYPDLDCGNFIRFELFTAVAVAQLVKSSELSALEEVQLSQHKFDF